MTTFEETLAPHIDPRWSFNMTVGCPEGWQQLVLDAHAKIIEIDPNYTIAQIKEKFGGLRYYIQTEQRDRFQEIGAIVHAAEDESFKVCETCGTREGVTTGSLGEGMYWILTLCAQCRARRYEESLARKAEFEAKYGKDDEEDE